MKLARGVAVGFRSKWKWFDRSAQAKQRTPVSARMVTRRSVNNSLSLSSLKMSRFSIPRTMTCWRRPGMSSLARRGMLKPYQKQEKNRNRKIDKNVPRGSPVVGGQCRISVTIRLGDSPLVRDSSCIKKPQEWCVHNSVIKTTI